MFKNIRSLGVFYGKKSVGTLAIGPDGLCAFEYSAAWLEKGFSISPFKLPLRSGVFSANWSPFEGCFGVFDGSLPDGWGRLLTDRLLLKHKINPATLSALDRLALVGHGGMGALIYKPVNILDKTKNSTDLEYLEKEAMRVLHEDYKGNIELLAKKGGSSGGARPKVIIRKNGADWLVKFRNSQDPKSIGRTEYEYSLAAKKAGILMPETKLFNDKYFGVKLFDRKGAKRFHVLTAAALLDADFRLPSLDYKTLIDATRLLTKQESECERMWQLCVFNMLSKNRDDHSKNFSFIYDKGWHMSPAYDLVPAPGFNGQHTTTVLGNGLPGREDLFALAKECALNAKKCKMIYEQTEEAVKPLQKKLKIKEKI